MHKNKPEIILYVKKIWILSKKFKETKVHVPLRKRNFFSFKLTSFILLKNRKINRKTSH